MKFFIFFLSICLFFSLNAQTVSVSGIINNYASVNSIGSQSVNVLSTIGFNIGDRVLLIQMKGATIDTTNTLNFGTLTSYNDVGNYELCDIASISSTTITFLNSLLRTYNASGFVQLVKVPVYNNLNVTGLLTCSPWNGSTGGVLAFEASGNVTLNANIDITGKGFLGGGNVLGQFFSCSGNTTDYKLPTSSLASAFKGEGITNTHSTYSKGLGALANGGGAGNDVNGGGAGGGNYGLGGHGGNSICSSNPVSLCGGNNGKNCVYSNSNNKIFLGGGGGAGHQNDGVGTGGVSGGGIILIRCVNLTGNNNFIKADGNDNTAIAGNDGQGGGGAGGTILIDACSSSSLTISAKGGFGGIDNYVGASCHGKGGGGGGGIIWASSPLIYSSVLTGGLPGVFTSGSSPCFNTSNGATNGQIGGTLSGLIIPGATSLSNANYTLTPSSTNVLCNGSSTGSASVAVSGVGPYTYSWSPGNYTTPSINNVSVGIYTITVSAGACSVKTETIAITSPNALVTTTLNNPICFGETSVITPTISGGTAPYSVVWLHDNSTTFSTSVSPTVTTTYTFVVTDNNNCSIQSIQTIVVNPLPILSISSNTSVCSGQSINLTANGASTYTWTNPNSQLTTISVTPTVTTIYTVNGASAMGCLGLPVSNTIIVLPIPILTITTTSSICAGQSATITATGATTYSLISGSSFTNSISVNPIATTIYTIVGVNNVGCNNSEIITVLVNSLPTLTINSNTIICIGNSIILTLNSNATSTLWNTGNTTHSISVSPIVNSYYSAIVNLNGCSKKDSVLVSVTTKIDAGINLNLTDTCHGKIEINCLNYSTTNSWHISNGAIFTNSCQFQYQFSDIGNYTITFITNPNTTCADTANTSIYINGITLGNLEIANVFTPNNDGVNDLFDFSKFIGCDFFEYTIYDRWGLSIFKSGKTNQKFWDGKTTSGEKVPDGTYFYILKTSSNSYKGNLTLFR